MMLNEIGVGGLVATSKGCDALTSEVYASSRFPYESRARPPMLAFPVLLLKAPSKFSLIHPGSGGSQRFMVNVALHPGPA